MNNYAKFESDKPLEGGSMAIFACNHTKQLLNMFSDQIRERSQQQFWPGPELWPGNCACPGWGLYNALYCDIVS